MQAHEQEIVFLVNSADPQLVECYTNCPCLMRQLEEHGAQRIPTPRTADNTLRSGIAQQLNAIYLLKAQQVQFLSIDELKTVLEQRRRDRKRKEKALSDEEKEKRARKAAYAKAWRDRQTPEKKQEIYATIKRCQQNATDYERELKRKHQRERWAKLSATKKAAILERKRLREAAKRAEAAGKAVAG